MLITTPRLARIRRGTEKDFSIAQTELGDYVWIYYIPFLFVLSVKRIKENLSTYLHFVKCNYFVCRISGHNGDFISFVLLVYFASFASVIKNIIGYKREARMKNVVSIYIYLCFIKIGLEIKIVRPDREFKENLLQFNINLIIKLYKMLLIQRNMKLRSIVKL